MKQARSSSGWIRENFRFTSLLKPMIYALIFGAVYNLGYLALINMTPGIFIRVLGSLWLCLYGLSWYFVATLVFGRRRGTLMPVKVIIVLLWFLAWIVYAMYIIVPLYNMAGRAALGSPVMIVIQLMAAFGLICMVPASILLFQGLYDGETRIVVLLRSIVQSMKSAASPIFNSWLILFIVMVVWDTLFSGPLTTYFGFNAAAMFSQLLYLGNPLGYPVLLLSSIGGGISGAYIYAVVLNVIWALILNFLDINLIAYIGRHYIQKS